MEAAAAGAAGVARDSDFEARDTVVEEVAVTTSSDASGNSGRGNCMLGRGAVSAAILSLGLSLPALHDNKKQEQDHPGRRQAEAEPGELPTGMLCQGELFCSKRRARLDEPESRQASLESRQAEAANYCEAGRSRRKNGPR